MRSFWALALIIATTGFMAGCNNCDSCPSSGNNKEKGNQESLEKPKDNPEENEQASRWTPEQITQAFLEAAKQKNIEQAYQCLTPTARRELQRDKLYFVESLAGTLVQYEVGETLRPEGNDKAAGVITYLTQQSRPDVKPTKRKMGWALCITEEGWRIGRAYVYAHIDDEESYPLNFENPKEIREMRDAMTAKRSQQPTNTQKNKTILR